MLDGLAITDLAPATLLGVAILLVLLGRLVPKTILQDKKDEAEHWRLAYEAEQEARRTSDSQTKELLELAKTTHALIAAIVKTGESSTSGGSDVASTATKV